MYRPLSSSARSFAADERGNVAVIFAVMSTVILLVAGIAIDYARTVNMSSRIGAAADAATLAAGRAMLDGKLNDAEVRRLANSYLQHNAEAGGAMSGTYSAPSISFNRDADSVRVDVDVTVPTTLTRIAGHKEMKAPVAAAALFEQKDVEVAMALDVTGSMTENADGGQRKIDGLKFAFRRFVEKLIPEHKADGPQGARCDCSLLVRRQHGGVCQRRLRQSQSRQLRDRAYRPRQCLRRAGQRRILLQGA